MLTQQLAACGVAYACLLTVRLPEGRRLGSDESSMNVSYSGTQLTIKPRTAATLREAEWLVIRAGGFARLAEAERFGRDLKGHLRLAAVVARFPLDVGDDVVVSGFGATVIEAARAHGTQLLHGVHGLLVYEETAHDLAGWGTAGGIVSRPPEKLFVAALGQAERLRPATDESALGLACDLVALAEFETSGRARFVALVTALEALVGDRSATSDGLRLLVDQWLSMLGDADLSDLDADELASFSGRLRELKRTSIKRSIRALVSDHAHGRKDDASNEDFAASCYDARSALVHGSLSVPNFGPMTQRLREIVATVIRGVAER